MSRINFRGCDTLSDVAQRHADQLPGHVLKQIYGIDPKNTVCVNAPIHGFEANDSHVTFTTEDAAGGLLLVVFSRSLELATSIIEAGDLWWSSDKFTKSQFTIDELPDVTEVDDSVMRTSLEIAHLL